MPEKFFRFPPVPARGKSAPMDKTLTCWAISDGRAGMENQVRGLAEAVARLIPLEISVKRIVVSRPFDALPGWLWGDPFRRVSAVTDETGAPASLIPPFPDLFIGCGRRTIPFAASLHHRKASFTVQTQDPRCNPADFDLVLPPAHDQLNGGNVMPLLGSPNRLTPSRISDEAALLAPLLAHYPLPRAAVLIGGNSKAYQLSDRVMDRIAQQLADLADRGTSLLITTSRRTPEVFTKRLVELAGTRKNIFLWDGTPVGGNANPYPGMLGLADHILVTAESTNMITEAATTGKPVHLLELEGGNDKFARFHESLRTRGITKVFDGALPVWSYEALDETGRAAAEIVRRLEAWRTQ